MRGHSNRAGVIAFGAVLGLATTLSITALAAHPTHFSGARPGASNARLSPAGGSLALPPGVVTGALSYGANNALSGSTLTLVGRPALNGNVVPVRSGRVVFSLDVKLEAFRTVRFAPGAGTLTLSSPLFSDKNSYALYLSDRGRIIGASQVASPAVNGRLSFPSPLNGATSPARNTFTINVVELQGAASAIDPDALKSIVKPLSPTGGTIGVPKAAGYYGLFSYTQNDGIAGTTIEMTNAGKTNVFGAPTPPGITPILYLGVSLSGSSPVDFQTGTLFAHIISGKFLLGTPYTMYVYENNVLFETLPLGKGRKTHGIRFNSPLAGVTIAPGTTFVMEIAPPAPPTPTPSPSPTATPVPTPTPITTPTPVPTDTPTPIPTDSPTPTPTPPSR